jgi:hypothetical protein
MATAARRRRKRHSPVRRRPSSNSQPIGRPAAPTSTSASKPGRPRRPPKHNQQNRSRLQRKGPEAVPFSFIAISQSGAARRMPRVRAVVKKQNPDAALHRRNGAGQRRGDPPGNCPASYQAPGRRRCLGLPNACYYAPGNLCGTRRSFQHFSLRRISTLPSAPDAQC